MILLGTTRGEVCFNVDLIETAEEYDGQDPGAPFGMLAEGDRGTLLRVAGTYHLVLGGLENIVARIDYVRDGERGV